MNSPRLLVTNFHSLQNAGDAALLQVSLAALRREFPDGRISLLANYPLETGLAELGVDVILSPAALCGSFSGVSPLCQITRLINGWLFPSGAWLKLRRTVEEADVVISCPGNPFFSMGRVGWPLMLSALPLAISRRANAPFLLLPQTLGPLHRKWERVWMRSILRHADRVFLREDDSIQQATELGIPMDRLSVSVDPCFLLEPAEPAEASTILSRYDWVEGQPALGVSLVPQMVKTLPADQLARAYAAFAEVLGNFSLHQQVRLFFFAQSRGPSPREDDRLPARQVMQALPPDCKTVLVDEPLSPAQLKACYAQMDAMLCMRLHAGLFAMGAATPALFVGYLPKTGAVLRSLGWQAWGIELAEINPAYLSQQLNALWGQRHELCDVLTNRIPAWEQSAAKPYQKLVELIRGMSA